MRENTPESSEPGGSSDGQRRGDDGWRATSRRSFLRAAGVGAVAAGTGAVGVGASQSNEQRPYDEPHAVPGRIPAVEFDRGGEGVAYHEASPGSTHGDYRDEAVDTQVCPEGGHNLGWIEAGEWWEYTVEVETADRYSLAVRAATANEQVGLTFFVDGEERTDVVRSVGPDTWQSWQTEQFLGSIELEQGEHVIRVQADTGGWNLRWFYLGDVPGELSDDFEIAAIAKARSSVTLQWAHGTHVVSGDPTYDVAVDGSAVAEGVTSPYTVEDLAPGTTYDLAVTKVDDGEVGDVTVTTRSEPDAVAPNAPREFRTLSLQLPRIYLFWEPARDTGGSGVQRYDVYLDGDLVRSVPATETTVALDDALAAGETYDVALVTVDASGNESDPVTTTARTDEGADHEHIVPPQNLRLQRDSPTSLDVEWDEHPAGDVDRFEVEWTDTRTLDGTEDVPRQSGSTEYEPDRTSHGIDDLVPGAPYRISVRAVDADGNASRDATLEVWTPAAPTDLDVTGGGGSSLSLAWRRPWSDRDLVEYAALVDGEVVQRVDLETSSTTIAGLPADGHHDVSIVGIDADGGRSTPTTVTAAVGTGDRPGIGDGVEEYLVAELNEELSGSGDGDEAAISVDGGRVWIDGSIVTAHHECHTVALSAARMDGETLRIEVAPSSSGCDTAVGRMDYVAGVAVSTSPSHVVVEHAGRPFLGSWRADDLDGTVGVVYQWDHMTSGERVEGTITLAGDSLDVDSFSVDLSVDDPAVARMIAFEFPDGISGEAQHPSSPEGTDATVTGTVDGSPVRNQQGDIVLARVAIEAVEHGYTTVDVDAATASTGGGTSLALGTAGDEVYVDASHQVASGSPNDLDRDGLFEDVNDNGRLDSDDVVTYFEEMDSTSMQDHYRFHDHNGNGRLDFDDVVALFRKL